MVKTNFTKDSHKEHLKNNEDQKAILKKEMGEQEDINNDSVVYKNSNKKRKKNNKYRDESNISENPKKNNSL